MIPRQTDLSCSSCPRHLPVLVGCYEGFPSGGRSMLTVLGVIGTLLLTTGLPLSGSTGATAARHVASGLALLRDRWVPSLRPCFVAFSCGACVLNTGLVITIKSG
jgi:hypothetical protein